MKGVTLLTRSPNQGYPIRDNVVYSVNMQSSWNVARVLCITSLTAILATGCGDDSSDAPVDAGPPAFDQCTGAGDIAIAEEILAAQMDGGVPDAGLYEGYLKAITANLQICAGGSGPDQCLNTIFAEGDVPACMSSCLAGLPEENLSDGCFECFSEVVTCATENCLTVCIGTSQAECDACSEEHCTPRLVACTGLPSDPTASP